MVATKERLDLEECLIHRGSKALEELIVDYFSRCEISTEYKIDVVCASGLMKLFCGFFKGYYGIIEIEIVGLYPNEIAEIEQNLMATLHEKLSMIPKRKGINNYNYEASSNRVIIRLYATESGECEEKEDILKRVRELSPAINFIAEFLLSSRAGR